MDRHLKLTLVMVIVAALVFFAGLKQAPADTLLYGYALPVQNLNGYPPSSSRSNGSPGDYQTYSQQPSTYQIEGDSFTIGSAGQQYYMTTGTLYMIYGNAENDDTVLPSLTLWGGSDGNIKPVSTDYTVTRVWYTGDENFQRGDNGAWRAIWQITFTLDATINGGEKYYYFLDGIFQNNQGEYQAPNLLGAGGTSLSGVTPVGTLEDTMLYYDTGTGLITTAGDGIPSGPIYANVALYGSQVPLPGALLLLGAGLVRLGAYGRRKKQIAA